jgi:hypothetical protein
MTDATSRATCGMEDAGLPIGTLSCDVRGVGSSSASMMVSDRTAKEVNAETTATGWHAADQAATRRHHGQCRPVLEAVGAALSTF